MGKHKKRPTMTDVLRKTIVDSGIPLLTLSNEAEVARASLIRFIRGDTSIRLDVADKLAEYFKLELAQREGR